MKHNATRTKIGIQPGFAGIVFPICAILLAAAPVGATGESDTLLASMRQKYDGKLATMEEEYRSKNEALPGQYVNSLGVLEKTTQEKGDLSGVLAIKAEQKRFGDASSVGPEDVLAENAALRDLQIKYIQFVTEREIEKNGKIVSLTEQYVNSLAEMEKDYTKKGQIEDAMKIRAEREQVLASPALSKAEFELADAKDRQASLEPLKQKPNQGGDQKPTESSDSNNNPPAATDNSWGKNIGGKNVQIYQEGKEPLGSVGKYRRMSMSTTDRGSTLQSVAADIMVGKEFLYKRDRDGKVDWPSKFGWNPHRFVEKQTRYNLRLVLGSKVAGEEVKKPVLLVEYFIKPEVRSKDEFQRETNEFVKLPNLVAGSKIVVDTSGITVEDGQYEGGRPYSIDFYGVIVSIFDGEKKLLYQTISSPALKDVAPASMPENNGPRAVRVPPPDDNRSGFKPLGRQLNRERLE